MTIALTLMLFSEFTSAKCSELFYTFRGQVFDKYGNPAVGAFVGASWLEYGQIAGPAISVTDRSGYYRLFVRFRPNDDIPLVGAACTDKIMHINLIAYVDDQRSTPTKVPISSLTQNLPKIRINESALGK